MAETTTESSRSSPPRAPGGLAENKPAASGTGSGWFTAKVVLALVIVALVAGGIGYRWGARKGGQLAAEEATSKRRVVAVTELLKPRVQIAGQALAVEFVNGKAPYSLEVNVGTQPAIKTQAMKSRFKVPLAAMPASGESIRVKATDATGQQVTTKIKAPY